MQTSKHKTRKPTNTRRAHSYYIYIAISLALIVVIVGSAMTQGGRWPSAAESQTLLHKSSAGPARIAQSSPTPQLVKEYIYAGSKLLATKEPVNFEDTVGNPYLQDIRIIANLDVTVGCNPPAPTYCPSGNVTRQEMAAFIVRALGHYSPPTPTEQRFLDVPQSSIFYNFIDKLAALGVTTGCGNGNYCPGEFVTHEQMATFMSRAVGKFFNPPPNPLPPQYFTDVTPANFFYPFIHDYAVVRQVWPGCSCPSGSSPPCFCPGNLVRRDQMARILVKNFDLRS